MANKDEEQFKYLRRLALLAVHERDHEKLTDMLSMLMAWTHEHRVVGEGVLGAVVQLDRLRVRFLEDYGAELLERRRADPNEPMCIRACVPAQEG